jgi:hypothetical protein
LALAVFDLNHDKVVDSRDMIFKDLRLWQDRNHDGVSDADELSTLESHGIVGLDLRFTGIRKMDEHGNLFRYGANVLRAPDSRVGPMSYDVFLITHALDSQARVQGAYQTNGAVSLTVVEPDPFCGGGDGGAGAGAGGGGGDQVCHITSLPQATLCDGGMALCFSCGVDKYVSVTETDTCHRVCEGWLGFSSGACEICSNSYSCLTAADPNQYEVHNCNSRLM